MPFWPDALQAFLAIVLAVVIPGWAWSLVLFPGGLKAEGKALGPAERAAVAVGVGLVLTPLWFLAASALLGIPIRTWTSWLLIAFLAAAPMGFLAWRRRGMADSQSGLHPPLL